VFGWRVHPFDVGEFHGLMLCVPDYGDFLETQYPGLKKQHGDMGAPEEFTDAIGWVNPMSSAEFPDDVPPHWSITFAVDDADAAAAKTAELGGKVLMPPTDAPFVRFTVVSDPQGAVFTASKYVPPS
jgi:hypothetical protein